MLWFLGYGNISVCYLSIAIRARLGQRVDRDTKIWLTEGFSNLRLVWQQCSTIVTVKKQMGICGFVGIRNEDPISTRNQTLHFLLR